MFVFKVEKTGTGYSAFTELENGIAATVGETISELKVNALECLNTLLSDGGQSVAVGDDVKFVFAD